MTIGIMGAGAIGCYLGAWLASRGADVRFVGRARLADELAGGLEATDMRGRSARIPHPELATDPASLAACDVVLVCVKSAQTAETARSLAPVLRPGAVVASMQNGVRNPEVLRGHLPAQRVLGGIVGFNVVPGANGAFRQTTTGLVVLEASQDPRAAELAELLRAAGFDVQVTADLAAQQWSKLIMNLNNAVGALSDAPTQRLLFDPAYRRILAATVREALSVMRRAGIRPARLGPLPVALFPHLLALPTPLLRLVARAQVQIDPKARSSMWQDLDRRRPTEVDYLNGEIVRLAERAGADAPLNRRMVALVHEAEARGAGSPALSAEALWKALAG